MNYPNNPVAAMAPRAFLEEVVAFAKKHHLIVAYDNAYSEMFYEEPPLSFLEIPGAKEVGIEFHSLSKTFNMTGWRIGWVAGNAQLIKGLASIKDSIDSGAFQAIQEAGIAALDGSRVRAVRQGHARALQKAARSFRRCYDRGGLDDEAAVRHLLYLGAHAEGI